MPAYRLSLLVPRRITITSPIDARVACGVSTSVRSEIGSRSCVLRLRKRARTAVDWRRRRPTCSLVTNGLPLRSDSSESTGVRSNRRAIAGDVALDPRQRRFDLQRHVRTRPDDPGALDGVADIGGGAELLRRRAERHLPERDRDRPGEEVLDHGRRSRRREPTDEQLTADGDTRGDRRRPRDGRRRRRCGGRRRGRRRRGRRRRRRRAGRRPFLRVRGRRPDEQPGGEHTGDETPCEQDK